MHHRRDPSETFLDLATAQAGVVSAHQVRELGLGLRSADRLVAQRHWSRLTSGVYFLGIGSPPWLALAWAGVLLGGPASRLGFAAAGHLWTLIEEEPRSISILVPWERRIGDRDRWSFPRERAGVRNVRSPGDPPRTTIEDTVIDLCDAGDSSEILALVTRAVQTRRTTARRIRDCAEARSRLRHRSALDDILGDVAEGAESALEVRYLRDVEAAHGLPRARRQHRSRRGKAYRDALYAEYTTIVELDGEIHAFQKLRDTRRDNAALLVGEVTLRYGWSDVTERPCQVAWEVAAILQARGWLGHPARCPHCAEAADADLLPA